MAHVIISVSNFDECRKFYERILPFLGLECVFKGEDMVYHVGARTALGVSRCDPEFEGQRFRQNSIGLHHLCFRARRPEDVDAVQAELEAMGATIVHGPEVGQWAPGYYSVLFEDPIGTRLEVNYVPGKGLLADDAAFDGSGHYR